MKKMILYIVTVIIIIALAFVFVVFADGVQRKNISFLESYGWEVTPRAIETAEFEIPVEFDNVYKNYNELQIEAGLDLTEYCGRHAVRYTYLVLNYPKEVGEPVRANLLCVDGVPIAGDIMTVSISGFMHSLNYPK